MSEMVGSPLVLASAAEGVPDSESRELKEAVLRVLPCSHSFVRTLGNTRDRFGRDWRRAGQWVRLGWPTIW
jgi:hypothetical protein